MEATNPTQPSQTPQPTGKDAPLPTWVMWATFGGLALNGLLIVLWMVGEERRHERLMRTVKSAGKKK